jgi:hypothetical protein
MKETETKESLILGQKYAFATASLVLGIFCLSIFWDWKNRLWQLSSAG